MDTFIELIVKKRKTPLDIILMFALLLAVPVVAVIAFFTLPTALVFLLVVGVGYGAWWLITGMDIEYEYCVTNGDIDVDQIIGKRKRKRLVSVSGRKIESLLPYTAAQSQAGYQRVVVAAPSVKAEGLWYFTYHSKKNGRTLVIFQPDRRVWKALFAGLGRTVQVETTRAMQEQGLSMD